MSEPQYRTVDPYDRIHGSLSGLPDVARAGPSTVATEVQLTGDVRTFVIETFRQEGGDTIFVQYIDANGGQRFVIPPAAANVIARQREALSTKNRKRAAKATAAERKARGEVPGFKMTKAERERRRKAREAAK